jgi:hypothetical protein
MICARDRHETAEIDLRASVGRQEQYRERQAHW